MICFRRECLPNILLKSSLLKRSLTEEISKIVYEFILGGECKYNLENAEHRGTLNKYLRVQGRRLFMGCTSSVQVPEDSEIQESKPPRKLRETRILQEEEVDVFINDEYDVINQDWADLHGSFLAERIESVEVEGVWRRGESAGGSRNDLELFATNPQYLLVLGPEDRHPIKDEIYLPNRNFTGLDVSCCLTQNSHPLLHIAFFIYRTDNRRERLSAEFFLCIPPEGDTGAFVNWRQVHQRFRLPPGLYVIVPAAFQPEKEGTFKLTVKAPPPLTIQPFPPLSRESSIRTPEPSQ